MLISNNLYITDNTQYHKPVTKKTPVSHEEKNCGKTDLNASPSAVYNKISFGCSNKNSVKHNLKYYEGCLFGGAVGDALGAPLEFLDEKSIKEKYGQNGLRYLIKKGKNFKITDDTQMTLFTTKGLLKSYLQNPSLDEEPCYSEIYDAYQDWYNTQVYANEKDAVDEENMFDRKELYSKRAPGMTCLTALESKESGTVDRPINDSFGNGAVMRSAPIGLLYYKKPALAFEIGVKTGAMTHGNPRAYLPSGFHAALIANIVNGKSLPNAVNDTMKILKTYKNHNRLTELLKQAIALSKSPVEPEDAIKSLGSGISGDEAMAIAVYSALKSPENYKKAVIMSVNHGGDSDTTGAITGNIMGAYLGSDAIPRGWRENLELGDVIQKCAQHLFIEDSEKAYMKKASKNSEKIEERRKDDKFIAHLSGIRFYDEDIVKMETMTVKEKLEFIKDLKENNRFFVD